MKKYLISIVAVLLFSNCVTQKEYDKALNDYLNEAIKDKFLTQSINSLKFR